MGGGCTDGLSSGSSLPGTGSRAMPVEDPRADAKVYLAKHNVEKIFEVRLRPGLQHNEI